MVSFLLFYAIGIPVSVLLHEIGHAIGLVLFSKERALVYLGPPNVSNRENIRIGRMHFHIRWSYSGFCKRGTRNTDFSGFQSIMMSAGGPVASLMLAVTAFFISTDLTHLGAKNFLNGILFYNFLLFISTSIPVVYPKWMGPLAGHPSDGYQILKVFKKIR
ncbi:hypothetical protein [Sporosarcina beigongshangi]|uniref:hypothetical protein n=1 Tax=Sporosarcina beigongshangi TaxID=2782538 RepID=UPI0019397E2B|nr:hypothetical protein [Sporosarcina beigongshangi]